jgi:ribosomal protein L7/L12
MKTLTVRPIDPKVENEVMRMLDSGAPFDEVVHSMRLFGLNKIESMKLLREHAHISLSNAKSVVHLSRAWQDHLESDSLLHDQAIQAAEQLGFTQESQ